MKKRILATMFILFSVNVVVGQGSTLAHAELFFNLINSNGQSVTFEATAQGPTYWIDAVLDSTHRDVKTEEISESDSYTTGFNLVSEDSNEATGEIIPGVGYGLYKIQAEGEIGGDYFYYDSKDCNYLINPENIYGSPDIIVLFDVSAGKFSYYLPAWGEENARPIPDESTLYLWWALEDQPGVDFANYVPDQSCFYADITLTNKYETANIGDFITVDNIANPISSGSTVSMLRGEERTFGTVKRIDVGSLETNHHHWISDNQDNKLSKGYLPDDDFAVDSWFKDIRLVTITTSTNFDVPISIHDPWYVEPNGQQLDHFHELNPTENPGGNYKVFKDEGDSSVVQTWQYAISVPTSDTTINGNRYVFDGWEASGALLAPYPGKETNELIKKVLFQSEGGLVKARYINLSALDGSIYSTLTISGDVNVTGNVTIEPGADVTFTSGSTIRFNPGTKLIVKGNLSADYTTFTRSDPNSSSRTYWEGIETQSSGTTWVGYSTFEGAVKGLYGNYGDVRAEYSTFRENDTGFYLDHVDTYYSHDNTFTNNNYGVQFHYSNVPFHQNTFTNNTYDGFHVLKSNGKISSNTFSNNGSTGIYILNQSGISLTDSRVESDIGNYNNTIEDNGSYGIFIDQTSTPDIGTYWEDYSKNLIYGGFNYFRRGSETYDIYSLTGSVINAEMNLWFRGEQLYGNFLVFPRASDYNSGGGGLLKVLAGGNTAGVTQTDSLNDLLIAADSLAADSLYDEAVATYRALIDSVPAEPLASVALTRLIGAYKQAKLDPDWKNQFNDSTLLVELNDIYTDYNNQQVGLSAYDYTITVNALLEKFPEALSRGDNIIKLYKKKAGYREELAYALFEQGGIYEYLSNKNRRAGKIAANTGYSSLAESNYDRILSDYSDSEAADLVRILRKMGKIEDNPSTAANPARFKLYPAYPNPFNPITTLSYDIPERSEVRVAVFDLLGRKIIELTSGHRSPGTHNLTWNGRNQTGEAVTSGIYLYRITAKSMESDQVFTQSRKMVLLK